MSSYGQFCPVAKAMELLDARWTLLLVRELLAGSRHFNDLRRGVPRMSPTLLSKRLRALMQAGVVERWDDGNRIRYELTPAGKELAPIVDGLGRWGMRWVTELGDEDLDPHLLLWDIRRNIDLDAVPDGRTVVRFLFTDVSGKGREWWLVITTADVDACDFDPGYPVSATITSSLRTMVRIWRGDIDWNPALQSGTVEIFGPAHMRRAIPRWLKLSTFAAVPRPA